LTGADRTVTGSCHLIEIKLACSCRCVGMYQGPREEARRINLYLPRGATTVDAIILSHGTSIIAASFRLSPAPVIAG
jgi:Cft2 family RNA processing exonuclease